MSGIIPSLKAPKLVFSASLTLCKTPTESDHTVPDRGQGRLFSHHYQQSRRPRLQSRLQLPSEQSLRQRPPSPGRHLSRVSIPPPFLRFQPQTRAEAICSVHAITKSLTPTTLSIPARDRTGIEVLESSHFRLTCFQTYTGTKFLLFTEPQQPNVDAIVRKVYELYADFVMKNPFYQLEMPIRCEAFDRGLMAYLRAK